MGGDRIWLGELLLSNLIRTAQCPSRVDRRTSGVPSQVQDKLLRLVNLTLLWRDWKVLGIEFSGNMCFLIQNLPI